MRKILCSTTAISCLFLAGCMDNMGQTNAKRTVAEGGLLGASLGALAAKVSNKNGQTTRYAATGGALGSLLGAAVADKQGSYAKTEAALIAKIRTTRAARVALDKENARLRGLIKRRAAGKSDFQRHAKALQTAQTQEAELKTLLVRSPGLQKRVEARATLASAKKERDRIALELREAQQLAGQNNA